MYEENYEKKMNKKKMKFDKHQMPKANVESSQNNLEVIILLISNFFSKIKKKESSNIIPSIFLFFNEFRTSKETNVKM